MGLGDRLRGTNEGAEELTCHLRRDFVDVYSGLGEEVARIFDVISAGGFDLDGGESGGLEAGSVGGLLKRSGDAADP